MSTLKFFFSMLFERCEKHNSHNNRKKTCKQFVHFPLVDGYNALLLLLVFAGSVAETHGIDFSIRKCFSELATARKYLEIIWMAERDGCMKSVNILKCAARIAQSTSSIHALHVYVCVSIDAGWLCWWWCT